jgi:type IV fimbrial biogenesis protein FimT
MVIQHNPSASPTVQRRRARGFTIIEVLVTVAVLGVLASLAAPNVATWIRSTRVSTAGSDLYATLILARSEAVKRNANVDVIPNDASAWEAGWSVDAGGTELKRQDAYPGSVDIDGPAGNVTFRRDGRLDGAATVTFTLTAPTDSAVRTRYVTVDLSGRPSVKQ